MYLFSSFTKSVTLTNYDMEDTYIVRFLPSDNPNELYYEHLGKKEKANIITQRVYSKDSGIEEFQVIQVILSFSVFFLLFLIYLYSL